MHLDRELQFKILETLRDGYPEIVGSEAIPGYAYDAQFMGNMFYLEELGLLASKGKRGDTCGAACAIFSSKITAKGLDFLEDDGGMSATLNTVTVKFDQGDLRQLITSKIVASSGVSDEQKKSFAASIRSLPAEGLKSLVQRLVSLGLDHAPDVYRLTQTCLEQFS